MAMTHTQGCHGQLPSLCTAQNFWVGLNPADVLLVRLCSFVQGCSHLFAPLPNAVMGHWEHVEVAPCLGPWPWLLDPPVFLSHWPLVKGTQGKGTQGKVAVPQL